ncbi:MAG: hypothetical protein WCT85_00230 [Parachlamydiales bacterium]
MSSIACPAPERKPYQAPIIASVSLSIAIGYLGTRIFTNINPIAGAIFVGTYPILDILTSRINNYFTKFLHSIDTGFLKAVLDGTCAFFITNQFMKITIMEGVKLIAVAYITAIGLIAGLRLSLRFFNRS